MENSLILILLGLIVGTFGTLIGAGGGFLLVPILIIFYPEFTPEAITAISMGVVAVNAISGSFAYAKSGRIDYKAGFTFALYTIPGSILGVYTVQLISPRLFNIFFGILLIVLSSYLFLKNNSTSKGSKKINLKGYKTRELTDKSGITYKYSYKESIGAAISIVVGYISPLLGIGGGIIHVPAMVNILGFPVHIATATSHFILAVMASVNVITHLFEGTYNDPHVLYTLLFLCIGVIPGAQLGAHFSHKVKGHIIIRILSICLILVGIRILLKSL